MNYENLDFETLKELAENEINSKYSALTSLRQLEQPERLSCLGGPRYVRDKIKKEDPLIFAYWIAIEGNKEKYENE